jgi:hypothetical protein
MSLFLMVPSIFLGGLVTYLFGSTYVDHEQHRAIRR